MSEDTARTVLFFRRDRLVMPITGEEFESWCVRNGGETYEREDRPGIVCRFPDVDSTDRFGYLPDVNAFQVITEGRFYETLSLHQDVESRIDEDDRLRLDTDDTRVTIDPR